MIPSTKVEWLEYEPYNGFILEEDELISEKASHTLYGLNWYFQFHKKGFEETIERLGKDNRHIIICVWFKNGATLVMSRVNLLGGVCDDCTCDEMDDEVIGYKIGTVEMNFC